MNKKTNETPSQSELKINGKSESELSNEKSGNKRLRNALIRISAAFLAAVVLISITSFSFIDLIKGPKETESLQGEEIGSFVKYKIYVILGTYANGEYALIPMDGKIVTVHFTKRYLESVETIKTESQNYFNGIQMFDKYVIVQGTVEALDEDLSTQMYEWFDSNKDWMVEKRVITDTSDYADYLSDSLLTVDTVNSLNQVLVFVLTGLAALLLLYDIVELILMAAGFYLVKPKNDLVEEKAETEKTMEVQADSAFDTDIDESLSSECINDENDSENIQSVDATTEKSSEKLEEK